MKTQLRSTVLITALTFLTQVLSFLVQMVIARRFGARSAMDVFWMGVTLPQYVITVAVQSLGLVFLPVFVGYFEKHDERSAWTMASGLLLWVGAILGGCAAIGMVFARTFLVWTAPGLNAAALDAATLVARWTWPTILAAAWSSILANLYQARQAFAWQAFVPFLGALLNLGLIISLSRLFGITSVAIAATVSLFVQMGLLLPIMLKRGRFRLSGSWTHTGVREVKRLLVPLLLSSFLIRWTPVIDRYLASKLPEGVVSHLGYAFRISGVLSVLISVGMTTVIFPQLAMSTAREDVQGLLRTLSLALRTLWLLVAPAIVLGVTLAIPVLTLLFQRGAFQAADSHAVARLLQIYLFSLGAACLGNITGRVFYALKLTKILAVVGPLEALAYVVYAYFLARGFGAEGIAFSYVIYFNLSLLWQILVLRYHLGPLGGGIIVKSILKTSLAALISGVVVWGLGHWVERVWVQAVAGGIGGLLLYVLALEGLQSPEWSLVRKSLLETPEVDVVV